MTSPSLSKTGLALELLNRVQFSETRTGLHAVMQQVAGHFGFSAFSISHYGMRDGRARVDLQLHSLPEALGERLCLLGEGIDNPVSHRARANSEPFAWHELADAPDAHGIMAEAATHGLVDGYCVPVHLPDGGRGLVSFIGAGAELDDEARLALRAISHAAHAQVLHLGVEARQAARLTAREREVLRWTAEGKTADATATILSISVRTVEYHLLNAARKLNASNRTQTVVEALRSRQLSLQGLLDS